MGAGVIPLPPKPSYPLFAMSNDKSLKRKAGMSGNRCVLTRNERIAQMLETGTFKDGQSPYGIPKTRVQKIMLKKKVKKEETAEADDGKKKKGGKK